MGHICEVTMMDYENAYQELQRAEESLQNAITILKRRRIYEGQFIEMADIENRLANLLLEFFMLDSLKNAEPETRSLRRRKIFTHAGAGGCVS